MKCHGQIKTNLKEIRELYNISNESYSIDTVAFDTINDHRVALDFSFGDWGINDEILFFRLKELSEVLLEDGDEWYGCQANLENDYGFFKGLTLTNIVIYLPELEDMQEEIKSQYLKDLRFEALDLSLIVTNKIIEYSLAEVFVDV